MAKKVLYQGVALDSIQRGQEWDKKPGKWGRIELLTLVRVMAVADGYVMARHKGCQPFTIFWKDFVNEYKQR